jgi:hypothetical protein
MIAYAFKNASKSGSLWSKLIAWKTGGPYSHVELWISGPLEKAFCFSSREGSGCSFKEIDLTSPVGLWTIVPLPMDEGAAQRAFGYAAGLDAAKVRYDYLGILGIGTGHGEHNDRDRFCSEVCVEALQLCAGWWRDEKRWLISPSALYKMATEHAAQ